jgi:HK97 family phage portal protein
MGIIQDVKVFRGLMKQAKLSGFTQSLSINQITQALYGLMYPGSIAVMPDNPQVYIDEAYGKNAWLSAVIDYISVEGANCPINLYEYAPNGDKVQVLEHELLEIIKQPNRLMNKNEYFELQIKFDCLTGNQYHYSPRPDTGNNKGRIPLDEEGYYQLYLIPPHLVNIVSGGPLDPIDSYQLLGTFLIKVPEWDVLHIRRGNTNWGAGAELYGESPIKHLRTTIATSNAAQTAQWASFKNGGVNAILNLEDINNEGPIANLKRQFRDEAEGPDKVNKVHITGGPKMSVHQLGRTNVELAVLESELQSLRKVCATFRISSVLFGDTAASTYNNVREAKKAAYIDAVIPTVNRILNGLNKWICPYYMVSNKQLRFEVDIDKIPVMQQDQGEKWAWLKTVNELTPNERLRIAGLPESESPEMDMHWFPSSLLPVEGSQEEQITEEEKALDKFYALHKIKDYE